MQTNEPRVGDLSGPIAATRPTSLKVGPKRFLPADIGGTAILKFGKLTHTRFKKDGYTLAQRVFGSPVKNALVTARIGNVAISGPAVDHYTSILFLADDYEPDLFKLLSRAKSIDYRFIDGGANIGYWSCLVASTVLGPKPTRAIEASLDTYRILHANSEVDGQRFTAVHAAIGPTSGAVLTFDESSAHAIRKISAHGTGLAQTGASSSVMSVSLDDLIRDFASGAPRQNVLIKLDLEGGEPPAIAALTGLGHDVVMVVEDRLDDDSHASCKSLWDRGWTVAALETNGAITTVVDVSDVVAAKRRGASNFLSFPAASLFAKELFESTG